MFSVEERERIRDRLIERARADRRITAAAVIGASAVGGDRWSDLDLTFGVADGDSVEDVLADWTRALMADFAAAVLFDLPVGSTIYRVFLFPGALQVDLSFSPATEFGARGPRFQLLFGEAAELPWRSPPSSEHLFGYAVHHVVRAHICIERGRLWQAEYWIHSARDVALTFACRRLGIEESYGRGFDSLPPDVRDAFAGALVGTMTVDELRRALAVAAAGLLREVGDLPEDSSRARPMIEELIRANS